MSAEFCRPALTLCISWIGELSAEAASCTEHWTLEHWILTFEVVTPVNRCVMGVVKIKLNDKRIILNKL